MKELCARLGWNYTMITDDEDNELLIGIDNIIYSAQGWPEDVTQLWTIKLHYDPRSRR